MEDFVSKARNFLEKLGRYGDLLKKTEPSHMFEIIFAYSFEVEGISLEYEAKLRDSSGKSADFLYTTQDDKKLCFELYRPEQSKPIKEEIERLSKQSEWGYALELSSRDEREHFRPEAQTIRLQDMLLGKVDKFPLPSNEIFSIFVVNCQEVHLGSFDGDDARMVMYGKTSNPAYQEYWNSGRVLGLCEESLPKKKADEFRSKISAVVFIPKLTLRLFCGAYIAANTARSVEHRKMLWDEIRKLAPLSECIWVV